MGSSTDSTRRLAVVIVVDGLRASALGAYGNTAYPTPQFDELASRSLLVEWLLSTGPTLGDFYGEALKGIQDPDVHSLLVADDTAVTPDASHSRFSEQMVIEPGSQHRARNIEATHAAAFFSQAVEQLAVIHKVVLEQQKNGLLWVHFSGLSALWDAPMESRNELLDEDDPAAPDFIVPPDKFVGISDPDELLSYRVAYAAQVSVIEACLAGFVEAFDELSFEGEKLAMIVGSRGFALGEHGHVGHDCQLLYSEQLHLPWLILADETRIPVPRVPGFAQPADVGATIAHWLSVTESETAGQSLVTFLTSRSGRLRGSAIASYAAGESLIRTPAWLMKRGSVVELYVKPDDRWEANDVSSRCPDIIDQLSRHLDVLRSGNSEPLAEELISVWR